MVSCYVLSLLGEMMAEGCLLPNKIHRTFSLTFVLPEDKM
jgi:hypothetical protein